MGPDLFFVSLALTAAFVGAALVYLRGVTRRVLLELCNSGAGADFWLRSADVLALCGSLILVLAFGGLREGTAWIEQLRLVLGLALAGIFVTVIFVASSVRGGVAQAVRRLAESPAPAADAGAGGRAV
jgi:hypothetical protein